LERENSETSNHPFKLGKRNKSILGEKVEKKR
jgi:hypothetical protein